MPRKLASLIFLAGKKEKYVELSNRIKREAVAILSLLKEWLLIYTWTELWIAVGAAVSMMGFWYLFNLMLNIQNALLRSIAIWSLIFSLTAGAATTNYIMKRRKDGA